jgi:hypothetical protein
MASISKFSTALLSVPNEITVAAANFNINFSLMKVEAPKEYHGLRDGLSSIRRREAEEGLSHITARTLGALFESTIPPIPSLTVAYGKRVSEISQNLEGRTPHNLHTGMFADRAGPDGTSIWAAATSGESAIAMHLLHVCWPDSGSQVRLRLYGWNWWSDANRKFNKRTMQQMQQGLLLSWQLNKGLRESNCPPGTRAQDLGFKVQTPLSGSSRHN